MSDVRIERSACAALRCLCGYLRSLVVLVGVASLATLVLVPAALAGATPARAGLWQLTGWRTVPAAHADQGLATVMTSKGDERIVLRGDADVSAAMRARGWWHIGDPDSTHGYLIDAYQAMPSVRAKLFVLTAPETKVGIFIQQSVPEDCA